MNSFPVLKNYERQTIRYWNRVRDFLRPGEWLMVIGYKEWSSEGFPIQIRPNLDHFYLVVKPHEAWVEYVIEIDNRDLVKMLYVGVRSHMVEIESRFGERLLWESKPNSRRGRIRHIVPNGFNDPERSWPAHQRELVDGLRRLQEALRPFLPPEQS